MANDSECLLITRRDAACRQLCAAIRMFFNDEDSVAIHTLAGDAREIFEKHCAKSGIDSFSGLVIKDNVKIPEKEIWNILNKKRNFFKHPGNDLNETIEFLESFNDLTIFMAVHDCKEILKDSVPPEVEAYGLWFIGTNEQFRGMEAQAEMEFQMPGLAAAPRRTQKQMGSELLAFALTSHRHKGP